MLPFLKPNLGVPSQASICQAWGSTRDWWTPGQAEGMGLGERDPSDPAHDCPWLLFSAARSMAYLSEYRPVATAPRPEGTARRLVLCQVPFWSLPESLSGTERWLGS